MSCRLACWGAQVLRRIFPVGRGLYEDYLSNFWCTTSVVMKWRQLFSGSQLMPVCAGITILAALPSMLQQMRDPSPRGLLLGMANSALAFFMFSFQVCMCMVADALQVKQDQRGSTAAGAVNDDFWC